MKYTLLFILLIGGALHLSADEPIQPIPKTIPYDHKKAELGRLLFMDPMLSSDGTVSCHSCHDFDHGGADPRPVSIGVHGKPGNVNAPTVFNSYFNFRQFWNGRAKDLKDQANGPLHNPVEMDMIPKEIETYISKNGYYNRLFREVFHSEPSYPKALEAIAEFEKALITPNCRFDRYMRGEIELSAMEKKGYRLFKTLGCITCHNGINVGGNSYQKFGLIFPYVWRAENPDRYAITHDPKDKNVYKVPTLRNIALTAPYFHDGSAKSLEESLRKMGHHNLGFELEEEEITALKAFLNALTGEKPAILREGGRKR
ncbi:cytochrome-c peroxidase [Hydrogenimonas cancrithermarum]|nr:cytochrome-c peroxidase [Hydrogenimonas cancrithermarum]